MSAPTPDAALATWLDALDEGIVLVDDDRVAYLNAAAAALLQVDRGRSVGLPVIAVLRDHRLEEALASGAAVELETRGRRVRALPVEGGLLLRDVSELRRAQGDAHELLAVLSHELRTPVTAILAALEALATDPPEGLRRRFLDRAQAEGARLVRLLEDLTVEARPPRERRVLVPEAARRAAAVLQPTLAEHDVRLELDLPEVEVWVDEDKLLQVLLNLIENAAVHGPDGAVVRVAATAGATEVRFEVRDEGAPLDPSTVEALFQPHSRGGGVKTKGTGLGLYVVRSIAQRWGGRAWGGPCDDPPGNAFGVTVPRPPRPAATPPASDATGETPEPS